MNKQLRQAILSHMEDGHLTCHRAHTIAQEMGVEPLEVGRAADEVEIRVSRCQIGLFGYGPKAEGKHKIVRPMAQVPPPLEAAIRAEAGEEDISCIAMWQIADRLGYSRLEVSNAVEGLGLRVSTCQLGCFPHPPRGS